MATFGVIDADTHVDENEATWQSLEEAGSKYVPVSISPDARVASAVADRPEAPGVRIAGALGNRWWLVENRLQPRFIRDEEHHPLREHRELDDAAGVAGRLRDMDKMGVDAQVIFPTFFIRYGAQDPDAEADLTGAYNRWLADRCAMSNGRLRWAAVLPLLDPDRAVAELRWAKENGACAIFKRGFDLDKPVSDKHFFPVYEEADSLNMPLCIHTGHPLPGREWDRGFPVMAAFLAVVSSRLPSKFPNLKFGFIEAGAAWISYVLSNLGMVQRSLALHDRSAAFDLQRDLFKEDRLYVSIDPMDQIEHLLDFGTEDNLIIGTDYCHSDPSANLAALDEVKKWASEGRISDAVARKILETNAKEFYNL
ncbi:MAG: amidohydrolase family protein [Chloroflexota bacterium]|nr:amidohydrolase family protein [Chloroflexota bacterium]MDE2884444.1 amidohydrolase family protein [Chloroflexota bacterium]